MPIPSSGNAHTKDPETAGKPGPWSRCGLSRRWEPGTCRRVARQGPPGRVTYGGRRILGRLLPAALPAVPTNPAVRTAEPRWPGLTGRQTMKPAPPVSHRKADGMELTSDALVNSLLALGVAAIVTTLWIWPRLAPQRALPVLGRIGLLTVVQISVLAVLALSVNNSFGFYTSWDDLLSPGGAKLALTSNENHK